MTGLGGQLLQAPHFEALAGRDQTELSWYEKCLIYYNIYEGFPDTGLSFPFHKADATAWKLRLVMEKILPPKSTQHLSKLATDCKDQTILIENSLCLEW